MSEMVDLATRALEDWDGRPQNPTFPSNIYEEAARIVLAAIREPTPAMVRILMIYADPTKAWQMAIDEALK